MNYTEVYFQFREMFLKVYLSLLKIKDKTRIELLKNSIVPINKTASIVHFNPIQTDQELIFQQLYSSFEN
ncbi:hypothetical protein LEP1GSC021_2191 [Leptospira noguchii str. 1993005606]|nr:hypothetical protein LEP1GSC021_2191 [Leptospira noguchii str. 1993005606]